MQRRSKYWIMPLTMLGLLAASGCGEDPKRRIAMLEEQNNTLYMQLEGLRSEMDIAKQHRDRCQDDLDDARQLNIDLQGQLAAVPAQVDLPGEWQAVQGGAMLEIPGSVLFKSGSVTLRNESKSVLTSIASQINSHFSGKHLYVFGHTDTDPIKRSGWKDNRELSSERALAVVRFLQSQGVAPDRLVACGWGEYSPVASNGTKEGKSQNRRVELFAVDPALATAR